MKYISNVDTLSALLDRLITERIKHFFFTKDGNAPKIEHQEMVIGLIKEKLDKLFVDTFNKGKYDYISENRTFDEHGIIEELDSLIFNDVNIGESDRARLEEVKSDTPDIDILIRNEKRLRVANEGRAMNKNNIDKQFEKVIK